MSDHKTLSDRYSGNWRNVQSDCLLCRMEKRTKWYLETKDWVVAEKLGGGPFVVYKRHTKELSDDEWQDMERVVSHVFEDFEVRVLMNIVESHWHGHLIVPDDGRTTN